MLVSGAHSNACSAGEKVLLSLAQQKRSPADNWDFS